MKWFVFAIVLLSVLLWSGAAAAQTLYFSTDPTTYDPQVCEGTTIFYCVFDPGLTPARGVSLTSTVPDCFEGTVTDIIAGGLVTVGTPHWLSYASVDDLDPVVEKIKNNGGQVVAGPMDVMDIGRMAMFMDPQGAICAAWQPIKTHGAQIVNEHGALTWNELMTNDVDGAGEFYTKVFGWGAHAGDVGGMQYTSFMVGERPNAGMMTIDQETMGDLPPNWMPYFACDDADAIVEKTPSLGGKVLHDPLDVPEVGRMATLLDPQGGCFAAIKLLNPE